MPLDKINSNNPIRGRVVPNQAQREDCYAVIAKLQFGDLGRHAGTLYIVGDARLDMQGMTTAGDSNLQVQIGTGTVAAAIIAGTVQHVGDPINQTGVVNGAISVLNQSIDTGTIWNLAGSLP